MTEYLPQLMLAWSIQYVGIASPGPGVALILGVAVSRGRLPAITTAFGIACGSIVLATATVVGIAVIFAQVAGLMTLMRFLGAAYLLFLAWKSFAKARHPVAPSAAPIVARSLWRTAITGFLLQLSNPKAILFWLAIAALGGVGDAPWPIVVLFVAVSFLNSFIGHGVYAFLLSAAPIRKGYVRAQRWVEAGLGGFFAFAAFKLAVARS